MSRNDEQLDAVFEMLTASHRRTLLTALLDTEDGSATVEELVDAVVELETHSPGPDPEAVRASLYHGHLPKLANEGFVDYDEDRELVTTTDRTELCKPFLVYDEEVQDADEVE